MLEAKYHRGFSEERLAKGTEPRVRHDENGHYIMSLSENAKVYFEDYYGFMENTYRRAAAERDVVQAKIFGTSPDQTEMMAYYRARLVIVEQLMKAIRRFYTDGSNFGVVMTPWCFGTVMLEKIEVYKERIGRGEVSDADLGDYPYDVIRYVDEIYKSTLLELFDFPEEAFKMRWQYSELLKRYSQMLSDITTSLQSVIKSVKNLGA
ncbi:hypothetical protein KQH82_10020 [bacterium]|nr:hypothetical protein [bacterium]